MIILILNGYDCGYIGGMKQHELKISQDKKIILEHFNGIRRY